MRNGSGSACGVAGVSFSSKGGTSVSASGTGSASGNSSVDASFVDTFIRISPSPASSSLSRSFASSAIGSNVVKRENTALTSPCIVFSAHRRRISAHNYQKHLETQCANDHRTTETHLTTSREHRLQHFADLDVTKQLPNRSAQAIVDYGHDSKQDDFVSR